MSNEGMFSKFGKKVSGVMNSADEALDQASDKLKEAVKGNTSKFIAKAYKDMGEIASDLNNFTAEGTYKSFKVISIVPSQGYLEMLLHVVLK